MLNRMALSLILWMTLLGMNVVGANSQGCEAIINGPLTTEETVLRLYILEINVTHPAVVRCHVTCLDQQGVYNPVMALIITSQEQLIIIRPGTPSRDEIRFEFSVISYCDAQNNYTMEFEYLVYSNSSILNHTVLQCGVVCHSIINPGHLIEIWGHSYGIIRYTSNTELVTTSSVPLPITSTTVNFSFITPVSGSPIIIAIVIVVSIIVCISFAIGLLYMRYRSLKKIAVLEEQILLMNVAHNTNKEEARIWQMEKELPAEQANNPSPTHTKLNQKLPDTISSQEDK